MTRIVVSDDEPPNVRQWATAIQALPARGEERQVIEHVQIFDDVKILEERRRLARESEAAADDAKCEVDAADIFIVDYDLINSDPDGYLTGEVAAYLARIYSSAGFIIVMNQFGDRTFDLTLQGHPRSIGDLNVGSEHIANRGLWGLPTQGFRPWQWPVLPEAAEKLRTRSKQVADALDTKVTDFFNFPDAFLESLPSAALEFLGGTKSEELTFREYVHHSGTALRRKDVAASDESIAVVAAARLAKWLERLVLSGQNIIVDAPHLALRYPSLLRGDIDSMESWNALANTDVPIERTLKTEVIDRFRFGPSDWLGRPAWYARGIAASRDIDEVREPFKTREVPFVFCEDISRFLPPQAARPFVSDLESPFARRYVSDPDHELLAEHRDELQRVDYRPVVRFAM